MNGQTVNDLASVDSTNNDIKNCYTATTGGAWSLTSVDFTDSGSAYAHTAAITGGAIYAVDSEIDQTSATYTLHEARRGGLAYLLHPRDTTMSQICYPAGTCGTAFKTNTYDSNGGGGAFYIEEDGSGTYPAPAAPVQLVLD